MLTDTAFKDKLARTLVLVRLQTAELLEMNYSVRENLIKRIKKIQTGSQARLKVYLLRVAVWHRAWLCHSESGHGEFGKRNYCRQGKSKKRLSL